MLRRAFNCLLLAASVLPVALAQTAEQPVRSVTDPGVVTTRQLITPAGVPTVFQGRVYGVAFGAKPAELWVLGATHVYQLDWRENRVLGRTALGGTPALQGLRFNGKPVYTVNSRAQGVQLGGLTLGKNLAGGLDVKGSVTAIPLTFNNELAVVEGSSLKAKVKTGIAPFATVLKADASVAYVSNWGGRFAKPGDKTAPTGLEKTADQVVVDARGIAASGTVSRIDLQTMTATHAIEVGLAPMGLAWDEGRNRLYVGNGNSDSLSVIDTTTQKVVQTVPLQPFTRAVKGVAPTALLLHGEKLFVACGGINAVLQINTRTMAIEGSIPTGWYPNALAISPDGRQLAVASLLGTGSGWRDDPKKRYVHAYRGSVNVIDLPDAAQLASYSTVVAENNRMPLASLAARKGVPATAVPERAGEPSLIEHVVFIVKENRTYDQLFGDLPGGNGDPSLVMFGEDVAPNHRRLAQQFVLLDNFYATGGNSGDGHQWLTQANETAYCLWPGYQGRSYPFDGTDPIAYSDGGFLWDAALKAKKTVRIYGEYAGRASEPSQQRFDLLARWKNGESFLNSWTTRAAIEPLNKILAANYPAYTNSIPDVIRTQIFVEDLKKWEAAGFMPNLTIVQLPSDHTFGTSPGATTPKAMVADNDLALGQMVEALSKSRFWPKMAIFVVEDDAQNGVDHVDGHRTVALAISPYIRRGHVDSTFYAHQSMLKTMELMLGLPALSLFDLIAVDMRASFTNTPDLTPYSAVEPKQSLTERNPPATSLRGQLRRDALDSARMRWDIPDAVPSDRLNQILWRNTKGVVPYPGTKAAIFAPYSLEVEDDDQDDRR